ncbi:MAG: hypothetical protein HZA23_02375 [Nitrospirae bacterium]|nr:hypothetical protein [Nitrospirota bacterium]
MTNEPLALSIPSLGNEPYQPSEEKEQILLTRRIREGLVRNGLFSAPDRIGTGEAHRGNRFRLSPEPFGIPPELFHFLERLGDHLLRFYQALNRLYDHAHREASLAWVADYLDQGKPSPLVAYGRMKRFKAQVPLILRPDLIPTNDGMVATELDAVPGGFGLTAYLSRSYAEAGFSIAGGSDGILKQLEAAFCELVGRPAPTVAIVVSEESTDYRPEMRWLTAALRERGQQAALTAPEDLRFTEEDLYVEQEGSSLRIDILYRFFELFDLPNIPKAELILYAARKGTVHLTSPVKPHLEEKLAFALFHHPALSPFWRDALGEETCELLRRLFPPTWILDPRGVPPHAVIPGLRHRGLPVRDWHALAQATQKERRYVIKPSGFSPYAWGGRGVVVGHDVSAVRWAEAIRQALDRFSHTPHILQPFYTGRHFTVRYEEDGAIRRMEGRARLSPYYFVVGGEARLGGILATVCPLEKKLLHGMPEAVMAPCTVSESTRTERAA